MSAEESTPDEVSPDAGEPFADEPLVGEEQSRAVPAPDPHPDAPAPDVGFAEPDTIPWSALLAEAEATLLAGGVESADVDARRIVEEATGHQGAELFLHLEEPATVNGVAALDRMVERRLAGEPLQYVLGSWGFRRLDLMVDNRVLIPRPETEGVVDHVLAEIDRLDALAEAADEPRGMPVVVDLGTGSGAIGLSVASERRSAEVHLVDVSPEAVAVARANLAGLGVAGVSVYVHEGSWFEPLPDHLAGKVAVLVSNPPYIAADEVLPPVVVDWEPTGALISGPSGLESVDAILADAHRWLSPGGLLVVEIGSSQGEAAQDRARAAGFAEVEIRRDLAGRDRALVARRPLAADT